LLLSSAMFHLPLLITFLQDLNAKLVNFSEKYLPLISLPNFSSSGINQSESEMYRIYIFCLFEQTFLKNSFV
jgi:hypothetical protein